jgi:hypothetical protein
MEEVRAAATALGDRSASAISVAVRAIERSS